MARSCSFAAITDEPEPEVAAAGHDRTIINLKPEHVGAWLKPDRGKLADLYAIFDDKARPYYEHCRRDLRATLQFWCLCDAGIWHPKESTMTTSRQRIRIPSLSKLLDGKTPEHFKPLRSPMADRTIYPEDLGTPAAAHRPDLVPVIEATSGGPRLKMTARRIWSGRVR